MQDDIIPVLVFILYTAGAAIQWQIDKDEFDKNKDSYPIIKKLNSMSLVDRLCVWTLILLITYFTWPFFIFETIKRKNEE